MTRLADLPVETLEDALSGLDEHREAQRLIAAIIYKRGPSVPMLAVWLDKREATIYEWFNRLEERPIQDAVRDDPRPGRPSKLTDAEWNRLKDVLRASPLEAGYDESEWTPSLAQTFLHEALGTEYSRRHVRRMIDDIRKSNGK